MPVKTFSYNLLAGVRVQVVPPDNEPQEVCIHNHEHATSREIFLGNETVTVDNGMHAVATQTSIITLPPGDGLWAIANTDCNLRIMVVTQH